MTPETYIKNDIYFDTLLQAKNYKQPILVATRFKNLVASAEKMNITNINDIDAFNKAMYNDVLLNRTCLTNTGEYEKYLNIFRIYI